MNYQKSGNFLIIASTNDAEPEDACENIKALSESLIDRHWIYVAEGSRTETEDTSSGIRYIRWSEKLVEHFGDLKAVIVVDNPRLAAQLQRDYADKAHIISWDRRKKSMTMHGDQATPNADARQVATVLDYGIVEGTSEAVTFRPASSNAA